jgi:hypothetical protein
MRNPFMSIAIARIVAVAPLALGLLALLALVLSVGADWANPGF